jgi:hypothetical protein
MKRRLDLQFFAEEAKENAVPEADVSETEASEKSEENADFIEQDSKADISSVEAVEKTDVPDEKQSESLLSEEIIRSIYGHISKSEKETAELKEAFPDFDLYRELQNPTFARLTAPENGIHAVDAYYAVHRKEIQSMYAKRDSAEKSAAPKKNSPKRPSENGISAQAPAIMQFDYRNAGKEQREALKKAIRAAAARGEKIYPRG